MKLNFEKSSLKNENTLKALYKSFGFSQETTEQMGEIS